MLKQAKTSNSNVGLNPVRRRCSKLKHFTINLIPLKFSLLSPLIASLLVSAAFAETPTSFPKVSGKDLNYKPWTAPADFPGDRTLVVVAFAREQQADVDTWTAGLGLTAPSNTLPWIEMPLINNPGWFMRWFINTGMRGGIPSKEVRSHVWTAYTDKKAFMQTCGMPSEKVIYALVVDRDGKILAIEPGNYSRAAAERLTGAFQSGKSN